mmetsp:Transcript_5346/g.8758  ORF Transcript_5346/g.8758 Transcript_5346/m.8758 type:complete len:513 (+) Transcript_5346:35-1573(+)
MHRVCKLLQHTAPNTTNTNDHLSSCATSNQTDHEFTHRLLSDVYPSTAKQLQRMFGSRYTEDEKVLRKHGREVIGNARSKPPASVIYPTSTDEVVSLVKICSSHSPPINIVPYAAGTSLESHILRHDNGKGTRQSITINLSRMDKVLAVYPEDMQCTVQPGVNWVKLNARLSAEHNLFLGVDPSPSACIGGMIGTCCSGPSALKYGTMRNQVVNMTVVLSDGTVIKTGQRAIKSVAGYDLNALFCGSEGTLGIVTEATIRLRAVPKFTEIAQASFDDMHSIGQCVQEINRAGVNLAAFEFLDEEMLRQCKMYDKKVDIILDKLVIMFKFCGPSKEHVEADIRLIQRIVAKYSPHPFLWSKDEESRHRLWKVRKMCFWAAKFANPGKEVVITDVAVPFSHFNDALIACKKAIANSWLNAPIVGHIGDGNFHALFFYDKTKEADVAEAQRLNNLIVSTALELHGTCTAEHGVGKHKVKWLKRELGENAVQFMKSLKQHIDPSLVLNPGNIVAKN